MIYLLVFRLKSRKGKHLLNNTTNAVKTTRPAAAPVRVRERKIGRATFIVSSRFNEGKEKDIVSTIARLVQHDSDNKVD